MRNFLTLLLILSSSTISWAAVANCRIEIQDVNAGTKFTVDQKFHFSPNNSAQHKNFDLPGTQFSCTLAFFDLDSGTMLSCENKDDMGYTFAQSDRSTIKEVNASNNLSFRFKNLFYSLTSRCE